MPLTTDIEVLCPELRVSPGTICVTFPGGAEVCVSAEPQTPNPFNAVKKLFDGLNSALSPLVPVFLIIDALLAVRDCLEAIPKAISKVSPSPVIDCLKDLANKMAQLIKLIPQTSVPIMIVMILDAIIAFLNGYLAELQTLLARLDAIIEAETRAAQLGNQQLQLLLDCARENIDAEVANLNRAADPLNRLIGVLNALLELAGLPCIPAPPTLGTLSAEALDPFREFIEILEALRAAIPVPEALLNPSFTRPCE